MTDLADALSQATSPLDALSGLSYTKGHGTGNDFVLVEDPDGRLELTPAQVAALCDRHRGIGADGLIRVVRTAALHGPAAGAAAAEALAGGAEWFMDYSNADGSIAEMCGNGVRVFVHYLFESGLIPGADTSPVRVGTRAGIKIVERVPNPDPADPRPWYAADMGEWSFPYPIDHGSDALVRADGVDVTRPGLSVDMGNPHTVVALARDEELDELALFTAPEVEPVPPNGTNVEFVVPGASTADGAEGSLRMRVHERGVGETQSCGTGACAAALATRYWAGAGAPDIWHVEIPGGVVRVTVRAGRVELAGPAALVSRGELTLR